MIPLYSLRARLSVMSVILVAGLLVALGVVVQMESERSLRAGVDADLMRRSQGLIQRAPDMMAERAAREDWPKGPMPMPPLARSNKYGPRIYDGSGTAMGPDRESAPLDAEALADARRGIRQLSTVTVDDEPVRVYTDVHQTQGKVDLIIQSPYPMGDLERSIHNQLRVMLMLLPVGLVLAGVVSALLVGRAMRPLREISEQANRMGGRHLSERLPVTGRDEFAQLSATLNGMLDRIEASFEKQQRFTADASHELKTPLAVIKTNASLIRSNLPGDQESVVGIQSAVTRMNRLIQDLLMLARADSTVDSMVGDRFRPVPLADAIEDAMSMVGGPFEFTRSEVNVMGSAAELERVFVNLLSNATRYAREKVCVSMVATDQWIEVTVRDDGPGIAPEHLPKLFDRFYRVDDDRNSESGGNGLGLAITQSIVHRHGGTISIDSEVGKGTSVLVRLPRIKL